MILPRHGSAWDINGSWNTLFKGISAQISEPILTPVSVPYDLNQFLHEVIKLRDSAAVRMSPNGNRVISLPRSNSVAFRAKRTLSRSGFLRRTLPHRLPVSLGALSCFDGVRW
jgi:hypothetical protein